MKLHTCGNSAEKKLLRTPPVVTHGSSRSNLKSSAPFNVDLIVPKNFGWSSAVNNGESGETCSN